MTAEEKPVLFPVSVSLKEGPGRVVEGKARGHSLAVDLTRAMGREKTA